MTWLGTDATITPGTGFTEIGEIEVQTNQAGAGEFQIVTTAQAYAVPWTLGSSQNWIVYTAAFKPAIAAGGAAVVVRCLTTMGMGR